MTGKTYLASYTIGRERLWYYIQHRHGIKRFALVLGSDVEMLASAATCGAGYADWEAGENGLALRGEDSEEVAVTDAEVAVADGDEVAGASVAADTLDCAIEHGIDKGVVGGEVDAVVHRALASKWVGAVAEG